MNLEAIALRRAEEQLNRGAWRVDVPDPPPANPGRPGPKPRCACGVCRNCRNRERMRAKRAGLPPPVAGRFTLGRVCAATNPDGTRCRTPISDTQESDWCRRCRKREWDREHRVMDGRPGGHVRTRRAA